MKEQAIPKIKPDTITFARNKRMHLLFGAHADIQNKQYHNVSTPPKNKDRLTHNPLQAL